MTVTLIFVALAAFALAFFILRMRVGRFDPLDEVDLQRRLRPVDLEAFRNLIDPDEEQFLRDQLLPREFRGVQRLRLRAAVEYIEAVSHNAEVLLQLGQAGRRSSDARVADAARHLVDNAARLRLYSLLAIVKLKVRMAFPGAMLKPSGIVPHYQQVNEWAALLARLQHPGKPVLTTHN